VFSLAALVPWTFFSASFSTAAMSLVQNSNLITKVYFPRIAVPLAPVLAGLLDFAIAFVLLAAMMLWYGIAPSPLALVVVPALVVAMVLAAAGVGAFLAALTLRYRDVRYVLPFLLQIWMYASPVVYPLSIVPPRWRPLYALNPMAGVIEGFRAVLLRTNAVSWGTIAISLAAGVAVFVLGVGYFRRNERTFADVV
jgi:lipopolysaccharide transport system permease protein